MRTLGWIAGGIFLIDGLVALTRGREAISWADRAIGPKLPDTWEKILDEFKHVDQRVLKAWGINNVMAGAGLLLVALLGSKSQSTAMEA